MPSSHWLRRHVIPPHYAYIFTYPYEVTTTRSALSHLVPRPPGALESKDSSHVILTARDQATALAKEAASPAEKWIKPIIPAYATPVSTSEELKNNEGAELVRIRVTPSETDALGNVQMARHILKREGLLGFYRGFLHNFVLEAAELSLNKACTETNTHLFKKALGVFENRLAKRKNYIELGDKSAPGGAKSTQNHSRCLWKLYNRQSVSEKAGRFCSVLSVATILYPLRTIALRCRVYEPLDRVNLSFLQMARTSLIIDGVGSLFQGYGKHISAVAARSAAKFVTDIILEENNVPRYWKFLCRNLDTLADIVVRPLEDRASEEQCLSGIPGLIPKLEERKSVLRSILNEKVAGDCALASALILFQELVMASPKEHKPDSDVM